MKEEHYITVGTSLLNTLMQGLGAEWTEELKAARTEVDTALSETIINATEVAAQILMLLVNKTILLIFLLHKPSLYFPLDK